MHDVVVVGAGPCGTAAARACAEQGLSTLCIEEHGTIGHPVQCAGLLSTAAFQVCRVSRRVILATMKGAIVYDSAGIPLTIDAGEPKAHVVDRGMLDREMADAAARAGVEFLLKTAVCGLSGDAVLTRGASGRKEIPFRLLVAADGVRSPIARMRGFPRPRMVLAALQAEVPFQGDQDMVGIFPDASPDFFGWVIPAGKERARVGLAGCSDVKERFDRFLGEHGGSCLDLVSGAIPMGPAERTYGHRTLLVGDAAGLVKPTSGGGIYTGVRSALHAAAVVAECCEQGSFRDRDLAAYERRWKEDFGRELEIGWHLLRIRQQMTTEEMDAVLAALRDPEITEIIVRQGDMDRPAALARRLVSNPRVIRAAGILVRSGIRTILK
ncbi:MAG: NAD(P)/FAD-dependent oxidoreductase [Methanomicrobiales archaeon]|nr:NAD(P)/FAD-dependent oxidoreductase [Methanomicrobiales archaeon]